MATRGPRARPSIPVSPSPWARLTTRARLGLACLLCALPLGLLWSVSSTSVTPGLQLLPAYCHFGDYSYQYAPDGSGLELLPLDPSEAYPNCGNAVTGVGLSQSTAAPGYQEPVRLFFVVAALLFGYAALVRRTAVTRWLVVVGVAATAVAAVLAVDVLATDGTSRAAAVCTALALVLVAPLVRSARAGASVMTMPPLGGHPDPHSQPQGSYLQSGGYLPPDQTPYAGPVGRRSGGAAAAVLTLAVVSVIAVVVGLSLKVSGTTGWHNVQAWGGVAVVAALLTLAPVVGGSALGARRAWQVAACGAGGLIFLWALFVLPAVGTNASLIVTVGVAAGVVAAWIAPGRTSEVDPSPQSHIR